MSKSKFLKAVISVLALLVLTIVLYNVLIEESSILSGISFDGYKDLV